MNTKNTPRVMYLCDGQIDSCTHCFHKGMGECRHTSNIEHAVNFKRRHRGTDVWWEVGPPIHEESRIGIDTARIDLDDLP